MTLCPGEGRGPGAEGFALTQKTLLGAGLRPPWAPA
jgi:hypothetical protein